MFLKVATTCLYIYSKIVSRETSVFANFSANFTAKSDTRVGHLNAFFVQGGGHLPKPIFKSSNGRGVARGGGGGGGGMLNFRIDRRIMEENTAIREQHHERNEILQCLDNHESEQISVQCERPVGPCTSKKRLTTTRNNHSSYMQSKYIK